MTWNSDQKPAGDGERLREKYLSRLQEISSKIETRSYTTAATAAVEEPAPDPAMKRVVPASPTVAAKTETAPASLPGAVPERPAPAAEDDIKSIAERLAPKFVDALAPLLHEIARRNSRTDETDGHLRDQQRIILALEEKILQLEQKINAQQELQKEQILQATTGVMNMEQRFAGLEGRVNTQAAAIRTLHTAQDQRRAELRLMLQKLGEPGESRLASTLPDNL